MEIPVKKEKFILKENRRALFSRSKGNKGRKIAKNECLKL